MQTTDNNARERLTHIDGTAVFKNAADLANELRVATRLGQVWGCQVKPFAALSPIDWYAERYGRMVGVLEVKSRPHASDKFPTVFLAVRKYLTLLLAATAHNCPAVFVADLIDGIFWLPLARIDGARVRIAGNMAVIRDASAIEPVIDVPIASMGRLKEASE